MDARLNVYGALGLIEGESHVIRNAGGVITEDEIRSLATTRRRLIRAFRGGRRFRSQPSGMPVVPARSESWCRHGSGVGSTPLLTSKGVMRSRDDAPVLEE